MKIREQLGHMLLEYIMTVFIILFISLSITLSVKSFQRIGQREGDLSALQVDVMEAAAILQRMARSANANTCQKIAVGGQVTFLCQGNFGATPSGPSLWTRITQNSGALEYQIDTTGTSTFNPTTTKVAGRFPHVGSFEVCNDADMNISGGGGCLLQPITLSQRYYNTNPSGRFFRFRLLATTGSESSAVRYALQGALFVRNPSPWGPGVKFQW